MSFGPARDRNVLTAAFLLVLATAAATVWLDIVNTRGGVQPLAAENRTIWYWPSLLAGVPQALLGTLLVRTQPRNAVAWLLLLSGGAWLLDALSGAWYHYAVYTEPVSIGASTTAWVSGRFGALLIPTMAAMIMVFPDGKLPRAPWWRRLAVLQLGLSLVWPLVTLTAPADVLYRLNGAGSSGTVGGWSPTAPTLSLPFPVWHAMAVIGRPVMFATLLVPFAVILHRYRHADLLGRAQIRWLLLAVLLAILGIPLVIMGGTAAFIGITLPLGLVAVAIAVAVTRHRLYDIDRLLPATAVYGALAGTFLLVDAVLVALSGSLLDERDAALFAVAFVAAAYTLARDLVWRWTRRLLLGRRADAGTVAVLARSLETATDVNEQLQEVTRTLTASFRLTYASVQIERLDGTQSTVAHGVRQGIALTLPITYRTEPVGVLTLNNGDRSRLGLDDQRLLGDLVRQAAAAVRATDINAALRQARTHLVLGREEERRRLRRDLHDGLGPTLGAIALRIDTARTVAHNSPEAAEDLLEQAAADIGALVDEIRRLVYDLRPPALDELGLLDAIRQQARRLGGPALTVSVIADEELPGLPAAVEVATYRIVSEAVTNVARHAVASHCRVTIELTPSGDAIAVEVRDDGRGLEPDANTGVGLVSIRERVAELGGTCSLISAQSRGTTVQCTLPLVAPLTPGPVLDVRAAEVTADA